MSATSLYPGELVRIAIKKGFTRGKKVIFFGSLKDLPEKLTSFLNLEISILPKVDHLFQWMKPHLEEITKMLTDMLQRVLL